MSAQHGHHHHADHAHGAARQHHAVAGPLSWSLLRLSALARLGLAAAALLPALGAIWWVTRA
jgi:hypothetical protein